MSKTEFQTAIDRAKNVLRNGGVTTFMAKAPNAMLAVIVAAENYVAELEALSKLRPRSVNNWKGYFDTGSDDND